MEVTSLELGGSRGQGLYALLGSRGRHSLVATRGGETSVGFQICQEVDHTGFAEELTVRGGEERGYENASLVSGLSNREGEELQEERGRQFISESGQN